MNKKYFGVMTVNVTGVELLIVNLKTHKSLEKVVKENYNATVTFTMIAKAEQYRESLKLEEAMRAQC